MADFKYKPEGETLRQFMRHKDFFRGLRGPVGSGKSVASAVDLFQHALLQEPNQNGIRRTRWGVVRNTGPQLKTTTIKTWLDWFPEEDYGPFRWGVPFTHHIKIADLDMEVIFLAMDTPEDVRKLLSLDLTGIWVNEAREVSKTIIDACTMRCGRFPPMREGGPSWYGIICDTNAPEDDHWWPIMSGEAPLPEYISDEEALMLRKPEGWTFFTQPPAMLETLNSEGHVIGYTINPLAENAKNLPADYYDKIITGKGKDWIDVYVMNRLGTVSEGKAIYPSYRVEVHRADQPISIIAHRTIYIGLDFGFSPAAIFGQRTGHGQWHIIKEIVPEDMSTPAFIREVKAALKEMLETDKQPFKVYGDPTGDTRSASREDKKTVFQIARGEGLTVYPAPSNDPTIRIETVRGVLDRMVDGMPGMLISPECNVLCKGFSSGYSRRQVNASGAPRYEAGPSKNKYSHPHDALQYMLLGAGEGRKLMQVKQAANQRPRKAKTKWNPFTHNRPGRRKRANV